MTSAQRIPPRRYAGVRRVAPPECSAAAARPARALTGAPCVAATAGASEIMTHTPADEDRAAHTEAEAPARGGEASSPEPADPAPTAVTPPGEAAAEAGEPPPPPHAAPPRGPSPPAAPPPAQAAQAPPPPG